MERETVVEVVVSTGAVVLFVAVIIAIGTVFSGGSSLTDEGGLALVVSIVLFVLVMTGVGYVIGGR